MRAKNAVKPTTESVLVSVTEKVVSGETPANQRGVGFAFGAMSAKQHVEMVARRARKISSEPDGENNGDVGTIATKTSATKQDPIEGDEILNTTESTTEDTMQPTKTDSDLRSTPADVVSIRPKDFSLSSEHVEMVESQSMNLLDDTAMLLKQSMDSLKLQGPASTMMDIDKVHAACSVAKNIRELLKLKLEAIKLQRSMTKGSE